MNVPQRYLKLPAKPYCSVKYVNVVLKEAFTTKKYDHSVLDSVVYLEFNETCR